MLTLTTLLALTAPPAHAGEVFFTQQGRLLDSAGGAVAGQHDLTVTLYADSAGTQDLWRRRFADVEFADGYYAVALTGPDDTARELDLTLGAASEVWLGLALDADPELAPRARLASQAVAARANGVATTTAEQGDACSRVAGLGYNVAGDDLLLCDGSTWRRISVVPPIDPYRYFRIYATSWTNGYLLLCNLSLFEEEGGPDILDTSSGFSFATDSNTGGSAAYVANHYNIGSSGEWTSQCVQTSSSGPHWWRVDLGQARRIVAFGLSGYPGDSHKPTDTWYFQGSNDAANWTTLWSGMGRWPIPNGTSVPSYPVTDVISLTP